MHVRGGGGRWVPGSGRVGGRVAAGALGLSSVLPVAGFPQAAAAARVPVVVGFGDSVPAGAHCGCPSFLQQYADRVGVATGTRPVVDNLAVDGSTSADLVELTGTDRVRKAVAQATVVVIMAGANDYEEAFQAVGAGAASSRYEPVAAAVRENVSAAIESIRSVNPAAAVVVADYWAAMEDGAVAQRDYTRTQLSAARQATQSLNDALWSVKSAAGVAWVSTRQAFRDQGEDDTDLLLPDGDHPNAAGTTVIADALAAVLPRA